MRDIAGKTAVITAGGNGIGRSMALALADAGAAVVVADIVGDAADSVRNEILASGGRSIATRTDVTKLADVEALADATYAAFGSADILCNNAGVAVRPFRAIWDTSYADLDYMIGINIWGVMHGLHVFLPRMRAAPGAKHIVNTSSMGALYTVPGNATYSMTKLAIEGLSDAIREELRADDIGVTVLYPGLIATGAAQNSGRLRSQEEQAADARVKPYYRYAEERGEAVAQDVGAGRGPVTLIGGGETSRPLSPDVVGPMVVAAIRANRPVCMTHPAPIEGLRMRMDRLLDGYHPLD